MSDAAVTREGPQNVRPGRKARMWESGGGGGRRRRRDREQFDRAYDHPGGSYYGNSIINPPVWEELEIAGYLFTGGLAGASSLLAAGAQLSGRPVLAGRAKLCASAAIGVSLLALINDLGRPERFLNMLRVVKVTSPMSVGTWILMVYAPLNFAGSVEELVRLMPVVERIIPLRPAGIRALSRGSAIGAAAIAPAVATYTAALIADTAVPAWHEGHRELPFLFAGSAASAAAGWGLLAAPLAENEPARRLAIAGAVIELGAEQLMERRLGMVAETLHSGVAGQRLRVAKALTVAGVTATAALASRSRPAAALAGGALLSASALTRFGIFAAGMASAEDPKYTVEPQRARVARGETATRGPAA